MVDSSAVAKKILIFAFQVWGLRETIGTVSGQNPSLRAPPRLATGIRGVSLQMEVPPRQSRWKQILVSSFALLHCIPLALFTAQATAVGMSIFVVFFAMSSLGLSPESSGRVCLMVSAARVSRDWRLKIRSNPN